MYMYTVCSPSMYSSLFHEGEMDFLMDFNLYTTELVLTNDSFIYNITLEAFRDDEDKTEDEFESFRLEIGHGAGVLPDNVILGTTVITIMNVGM